MALMMLIIFLFSAMEGEASASTSGIFLKALKKLAEEVSHKGFTEEALANLHLIIRKCAHFTEYALLGASIVYAFFYKFKERCLLIITSEAIAFLYAVTDELHQYFVPGRYGTFSDVLIDSAGAITGIFVWYCIFNKKVVS